MHSWLQMCQTEVANSNREAKFHPRTNFESNYSWEGSQNRGF